MQGATSNVLGLADASLIVVAGREAAAATMLFWMGTVFYPMFEGSTIIVAIFVIILYLGHSA